MDSVLQAGVISAPLQVIIDRLATFTVQETSVILGVDEEVRKLQRTLERIKAMVGHVEESRSIFSNGVSNEAWKLWLEDVEMLLYSADDLIDGISLDLSKYRANDAGGENQVRNMIFSSFKVTVPREISKIRHELEGIAKEIDALYMTELTKPKSHMILKSKRGNSSYSYARSSIVDEESVIGRDRERNEIVEMLLDENLNQGNVSVVPVVGMGGIGKTTLAQFVYNNTRILDKFDMKMWASVSTDFDTIGIIKSIIESASSKQCKLSDLDPVQVKLRDLICGRRFLLVLDDYWSEEYRDWDVLSSPFKYGAKGSKIMLTTRSITVSRIVGTVPSYCLACLSDENCWQIVKQRACSNRSLVIPLEEIGRMIARKCKGLPLAAKTLGSMLHFKDPAEWMSILESEIWDLPHDKNDIFPALTLSYYHLPAQLKKCFTYCSIFPKNYEFEMNELVLLWMAEGLIYPSGKIQLEDVGIDYFKNLLWRSLFQLAGVNIHGHNIYKMHDLIHSMAQLISARSVCMCQEDNQRNEEYKFFRNTRHFSLHYASVQPIMLKGCLWYKNLRTFRVISEYIGRVEVSYDLFLKLKSLRVLDLSRLGLHELPDSIDNLKHLRYLNLSENCFIKLPESLTNLFGLQILKLDQCIQLLELPSYMKNMVGLRHLHLDIKKLNNMPAEFGKLVNLQALSAFIVGKREGYGIGELKNMRFLRGSICIKNLENVSNVNEAKEAMLHMKPFLNRVELEWSDFGFGNNHEAILSGLRPHENLKELSMSNYGGFMLPSWFLSCKLSSIYLQRCSQSLMLTFLGKLQHLKSLVIEDMSNWSHIEQGFSGFPSLESLTIKDIPNLTSWGLFNGSRFPCLRTLDISDCPVLTNLPSLSETNFLHCLSLNGCPEIRSLPDDGLPVSLQALVISDCDIIKDRCRVEEGADWYKIRSIPKIEIDFMEIDQDMRRF